MGLGVGEWTPTTTPHLLSGLFIGPSRTSVHCAADDNVETASTQNAAKP